VTAALTATLESLGPLAQEQTTGMEQGAQILLLILRLYWLLIQEQIPQRSFSVH